MGGADVGVRLFGMVAVDTAGGLVEVRGTKQRVLLAVLGSRPGKRIEQGRLLEALWPEGPDAGSVHALQTQVSRLRGVLAPLGGEVLVGEQGTYRLAVARERVDVAVFAEWVQAGQAALRQDEPDQALEAFDRALGLAVGAPFAELADHPALVVAARHLEELVRVARQGYACGLVATGRHGEAVALLGRHVDEHPLDESAWGELMVAQYGAGRASDALASYRQLTEVLAEQVGAEPSPRLQELHERMLRHDPQLTPTPAAGAVASESEVAEVEQATSTVLFTDMVGSTELRQRLGEQAADRLQQTHDELLGKVIEKSRGRLVKGTGDGVLGVFGSAADAVGAAVAAQQAIAGLGPEQGREGVSIRVGLSAGDVATTSDGDVHGTAVVEAARLCDAAQGGQILAADLVRALARGRAEVAFEPIGQLDLKGLPASVPACQIGWEQTVVAGDGAVPFPPLLAPPSGLEYVGRPGLLEQLAQVWSETLDGGGRGVLLAGEPGVGKTRTAGELARRVSDKGGLVLYGRCDESLSAPYQPFVEALDWQTRHDPQLSLGRLPGELARLLPELDDRVADLPAPVSSDPQVERHRLFEAVASWLAETSHECGLTLVIDDLHWAGEPTIRLLVHVLRAASADPDARLLVVGTYRDTDIDETHPLSDALGDLRRVARVERRTLGNLSAAEVVEFVSAAAGHDLDEAARNLAHTIHADTDGNPFLVGEVLRHLIETGTIQFAAGRWMVNEPISDAVPEGIRDVVGRRLSRLSNPTNQLLRTAAIVGRDVDVAVLAAIVDLDEQALLDAIDEALRTRLIEETGPDTVRFSHAIVRTTLDEQMSALRRRRQHRQVLEVLEDLHPDDVEALAHHAIQAGQSERALRHCVAAGARALAKRAHGDALRWFEQALEFVDDDSPDEEALVARCGLGEAQRDLGDPAARTTLLDAGHRALQAGNIDLAVRAVTTNTRLTMSVIGDTDTDKVDLLEDVLREVDPERVVDRARVLALLAAELTHDADQTARRLALADEAADLTDDLDDPGLRAWLMTVTHSPLVVPDRTPQLLERAPTMIEAADRSGDPALRCVARLLAPVGGLSIGDFDAVRGWLQQGQEIAVEAAPVVQWMMQSNAVQLTAYDGDVHAAREANAATLQLGQEAQEPDAAAWWGGLEIGLAWLDGSLPALADALGAFADQYPGAPVWRAIQVCALSMGNHHEQARTILDEHHLTDPASIPEDWLMLGSLTHLAAAAYESAWADLGDGLLPPLTRHRDLWAHWVSFCAGPLELGLGLALAASGRNDQAVDATRRARDLLAERSIRSHLPVASLYHARVLIDRGLPDDLTEATTVAHEGLEAARSMGLEPISAHLQGVLARL